MAVPARLRAGTLTGTVAGHCKPSRADRIRRVEPRHARSCSIRLRRQTSARSSTRSRSGYCTRYRTTSCKRTTRSPTRTAPRSAPVRKSVSLRLPPTLTRARAADRDQAHEAAPLPMPGPNADERPRPAQGRSRGPEPGRRPALPRPVGGQSWGDIAHDRRLLFHLSHLIPRSDFEHLAS
jgi:hypothetical protein